MFNKNNILLLYLADTYSNDACMTADEKSESTTIQNINDVKHNDLFDCNIADDNIESIIIQVCECGIEFESMEKLKLHYNKVHEPQKIKFQCNVCHKIFAESKILRRHMKIHSPHKPHVCPTCNMSFAESSNLTKHKKKHTGELRNIVGKPNLCSVCGNLIKY